MVKAPLIFIEEGSIKKDTGPQIKQFMVGDHS